jgi:hypothetical protein
MALTFDTVVLLLALVCFIVAALEIVSDRINLVALGLALVTASLLF